jgi:ABC-2 type transport system permease protein
MAEISAAKSKAYEEVFHVKSWKDLPPEESGKALQLDDHVGYGVFDKFYNRLWDLFEKQQLLQERLGAVSPLVALRSLSTAMAGTDLAHQRDFATAAERHRRLIQDMMSEDRIAHGGAEGYNYQAPPELWAKVPPFRYSGPTSEDALVRRWGNLATLAVGLALSFIAAVVATRRLRPL